MGGEVWVIGGRNEGCRQPAQREDFWSISRQDSSYSLKVPPALRSVEIFDGQCWRDGPRMRRKRFEAVAVVHNEALEGETIYVVGGFRDNRAEKCTSLSG